MLTLALVWLALLIVSIAISTFALRWGGRVARVEWPTVGRALTIVILIQVLSLIFMVLTSLMREPLSPGGAIAREAGVFLVASFIAIMLIQRIMKASSLGRAALAWLFFFGSQLLLVAVTVGLVLPFVSEAFVIPTNSMAP